MDHVLTVECKDPFAASSFLSTERTQGSFGIVDDGVPATVLVSATDHPGVVKVAQLFQKDLSNVSGNQAQLIQNKSVKAKTLIIIGTLDKSELIDELVKQKKIDVSELKGKWEQFLILHIRQPFAGVENALLIVGSDKRGTMFGVFDLSENMGVSPWYWWADVPVKIRKNIFVKAETKRTLGQPKVKYRGIFINDEAPALTNWAKEKFGGFNHHFYEKVFELILRKKANYLWPAMWRPAVFATDDPENLRLADEYGVVISTTHHEPMMRYHEEWSRYNGGAWNYETNKEKLQAFWREGIERMNGYESVVTLGMRGDGDEAMSEKTAVDLMKKIIVDQRQIIADVTKRPVEETPQAWAIYKEVQDYYDKGLRVNDDILVLFCDDNWGNIRILPKKDEINRKGGYGMYYHFDFVGGPVSYRWINVTQIERVWEQMNLAYDGGIRDLWIVNVGDIKPMELPINFFLDFAWNTDINADDLPGYYQQWSEQQFGTEFGSQIGKIVAEYTKFSARRTPEMLEAGTYSLEHYREADNMLAAYDQLWKKSKHIYDRLQKNHQSAYYQLAHFPIEISKNLNEMYVAAGKNDLYRRQGRASTNIYADSVKVKFKRDGELTEFYHRELAGGKWNHMMSQTHIGYTDWNNPPVDKMPEVSNIDLPSSAKLGYVVEHGIEHKKSEDQSECIQSFPAFDPINDQTYYLEIFNKGREELTYRLNAVSEWIKLSAVAGTIQFDEKIFVAIDWTKVPKGQHMGEIVISGAGEEFTVQVPVRNDLNDACGFVENNGVVSIEAVNFTRKSDTKATPWTTVPNLGRTGSSMTLELGNALSDTGDNLDITPYLEYDFTLLTSGKPEIETYLSPTLNFLKGEGLKYAIAIDDEEPKFINMHEGDTIPDWEYPEWWNNAVTDHIRKKRSYHGSLKAGKHTLKIWAIDPGVVFQKFVINTGGLRTSYLGPPESIKSR